MTERKETYLTISTMIDKFSFLTGSVNLFTCNADHTMGNETLFHE